MKYQFHIFCCLNQRPEAAVKPSCAGRGAIELFDYLKKRVKEDQIELVRVNKAGCLDQCEEGPVLVIYPEGAWYKIRSTADIDAIVDGHLKNHKTQSHMVLA